jgi:hypothetical protein
MDHTLYMLINMLESRKEVLVPVSDMLMFEAYLKNNGILHNTVDHSHDYSNRSFPLGYYHISLIDKPVIELIVEKPAFELYHDPFTWYMVKHDTKQVIDLMIPLKDCNGWPIEEKDVIYLLKQIGAIKE